MANRYITTNNMSEKKTVSEQLIEDTQKANQKAKEAEKRNENNKRIISIDGKLKVDTDEDRRKNALLSLNESLKGGKILTGHVTGVEKVGKNGPSVAVLYMEDFKIIIPALECIDIPDPGDRDPQKYEQYLLSKRLKSEIDYVVKGIDEDKEIVVASRKEAMDRKCKEFLLETDKDGNYIVYEGAVVEARVVCTTRAGIIVEIFGVESYIPSRELSYQRIQDATQEFMVGQRILSKILTIDRDLENETVTIEASIKQANPNPYAKAMKRYNVNDKYVGEVSMIDENGVFVALEGGVDVLCKYPERGARPPRGTIVTVRITTKNEEMNRLFGLITHVSKIVN